MKTGEIIAINISPRRGTQKKEIPEVNLIKGFGLENDAHGGNWHRQVSLLSIVSGIDLRQLPVGTKMKIGDSELVVTQIGKECHKHCQIYARVGDCIMPREGIFAVVVTEGHIKKGDQLDVV
ncbi:molybdenum cofactor biosynthesis protein MoaC [Enterococcus faecalis]